MKGISRLKTNSGLWFVFLLAVFSVTATFFAESTYASTNCVNGYCYETGSFANGGSCGAVTNSGAYWDTCFGLSWQYYEWPANYHENIEFRGTANSGGKAVVLKDCEGYGGFWFLGYEVYTPSEGTSRGYQVAKPKVSMLSGWGGRTPLYPFSSLSVTNDGSDYKPKANPYVAQDNNDLYLKGKKYGRTEDVQAIFDSYANNGEGLADEVSFEEISWFCAAKKPPVDDTNKTHTEDDGGDDQQTSWARGRSVVRVSSTEWERTAWGTNNDSVTLDITIPEGTSKDVTFRHRMFARGELAQTITYRVTDLSGALVDDGFYEYDGRSMEDSISLYEEVIPVNQEGLYCQTLTINYERPVGTQTRVSTACINVTVSGVPEIPPEFYGKITATANGETVSSEWNSGTDNPVTLDVTIHEGESVDVDFKDILKGVDGSDYRLEYETTNSYYIGRKETHYFDYKSEDSGTEQEVSGNLIDDIKKTMTVCETLKFRFNSNVRSAEACVRVTLITTQKQVSIPDPRMSYVDFNVKVSPYLSLTVGSGSLKKTGQVNEFLRVNTNINVATNNINGYIATLSSSRKSTDSNPSSLYNNIARTLIGAIESPVRRDEFPTNRWGFSFDDTEDGKDDSIYNGLQPADSNTPYIFGSKAAPADDDFDVYFATKLASDMPAGIYSSEVSATAVAVPSPDVIDTIDDLVYMQEITDDIVGTMETNVQYKLYDRRDGKGYWVAKMEDGTVWMTQNLDYAMKKDDMLYSGDTDLYVNTSEDFAGGAFKRVESSTLINVKTVWASPNASPRLYGDTVYYAGNIDRGPHSYRPASDPLVGTTVTFETENDGGIESTTTIIPNYIVNGTTPAYYASDADCAARNGVPVSVCEHWHVGVYYNYTALFSLDEYNNGGVNTMCPARWTVPNEYKYRNAMDGKTVNELLGAPYYFNYAGVYGTKNGSVKYSAWLNTKIKGFAYQYMPSWYDGSWLIATLFYPYYYPEQMNDGELFYAMDFTTGSLSAATMTYDARNNAALTTRCVYRVGY